MAAITSLDTPQTLTRLVQRWDRRWRTNLTVLWLPRVLAPALIVGLALAIIARLRPFLPPDQIALIVVVGMAVGALTMSAIIWLRERSVLQAARRFDVLLGLNERISTALELMDGRIVTTEELAQLQLEDAQERARAAHPSKRLPMQVNFGEWLALAVLAAIVAFLLLLPNPQDQLAQNNAVQQAAVDDAENTLQQITEEVASDPNLSDEERRNLLDVLETAANTLSQNDVSAEEAFAAVTDTQNALEALAEMFNQQLNASDTAASAAAAALQSASETQQSTDNFYQQLAQALQQLAQASGSMTGDARQTLSQQLQEAASQLMGSGNQGLQQAGQQMQQAASQMQGGDVAAASQSLQQAAQSAQQGSEAAAQNGQSAQTAAQQAQNAAQAAENISQSQSSQSEASAQESSGEQGEQSDSEGQNSASNNPDANSQQASQGGQQGNQQSNQSGGGSGEQGQMSNQSGAQSGQLGEGAPSQNQEGAMSAAQGQSEGQLSAAAVSESGAGAGDEQGAGQTSSSSQANMQSQSNNPDGQGERDSDELIFAPRRLGGPLSGEDSFLQSDDPNAPVIQGQFSENPTGSASVPYSQVFSSYANAASQALENGYVPLGLRDLIRSYFSSLEPSGTGS